MKKNFELGNIVTISVAHLVHDVFSSFLAPLLPLLIEKLSISYSLAGMLTVIQRIPSLLNPLIGVLADKMPIRYLLIVAPSITAISMSLLGFASSYFHVVIILLTAGFSASLFHVPAPVMIKRISGNYVGKGMSFFMFGGEIARSIGPILVLGAVSFWGLEGTYKLIPIGIALSFLLFIKFRNTNINYDFKKSSREEKIKETIIKLFPTFLNITAIVFFLSLIKGALTLFLPTFITSSKGESLWAGGISLAVLQFSGALGTFAAGTISDKIGRKKTLLIMSIVSPILMLLYLTFDGIIAVPLLLLMGFFIFASTPVLLAIINDIDSEHPAMLNGIFMTINFLVSAIATVLVGFIGDKFDLTTAYYFTPALGLLAIPFIARLNSR
jgi:FSR family fosmidomycin resistance protein-like MFS transporter